MNDSYERTEYTREAAVQQQQAVAQSRNLNAELQILGEVWRFQCLGVFRGRHTEHESGA